MATPHFRGTILQASLSKNESLNTATLRLVVEDAAGISSGLSIIDFTAPSMDRVLEGLRDDIDAELSRRREKMIVEFKVGEKHA